MTNTPAKENLLTHKRARSDFDYDPTSGVLKWRRTGPGRPADRTCGTKRPDGYLVVRMRIEGRAINFYAYRLIWFLVTGTWPSKEIDHANLDRGDNRWVNLRDASHSQNNCNTPLRSDNITGFKGVSVSQNRAHLKNRYRAQIAIRGKLIRLGHFDCPVAAHLAYVIAANKLHGEFARTE